MEAELSSMTPAPAASVPSGQRPGDAAPRESSRQVALDAAVPRGRAGLPVVLVVLLAALTASVLVSLSTGAVGIPVREMMDSLFGGHALSETQRTILFAIRLPRVLASALVGAALAISGLMFQGLFRNPMADPYIIGASGGAGLGACVGMVLLAQFSFFGFSAAALLAFAGSVLSMIVVYALARSRGRTSGVGLLLSGFAVGMMLGGSTYLFEVFNPDPAFGRRILAAWLHGAIGVPEWPQLAVSFLLFTAATVAAYPLMRRLNTLALGDEYAHQLGLRVETTRVGIILVGSLLTAIAVSLGGLIGFAGLIVPHVVRLLLGPDHVRLLPAAALAGAIFLVAADTLARTLFAPTEVPVGILMVFLGGPFFLYLLRKSRREYAL